MSGRNLMIWDWQLVELVVRMANKSSNSLEPETMVGSHLSWLRIVLTKLDSSVLKIKNKIIYLYPNKVNSIIS